MSHFFFGEGNGNPLQCSCLENPRDRGASWASVYGVTQSQTRLKRLSSSSSFFWTWISELSNGVFLLKCQWNLRDIWMCFCLFEFSALCRRGKADRNMCVVSMRAASLGPGGNLYHLTCRSFAHASRLFGHHMLSPKTGWEGMSFSCSRKDLRVEIRMNFGSVITIYQARRGPGDVLTFPWNC